MAYTVGRTARGQKMAKARKGSTPKPGQTKTLKAKPGQKKITMKVGGLHASTGTPQGQKIPASKLKKAMAGGYGPLAKKQAMFMMNVLTGKK